MRIHLFVFVIFMAAGAPARATITPPSPAHVTTTLATDRPTPGAAPALPATPVLRPASHASATAPHLSPTPRTLALHSAFLTGDEVLPLQQRLFERGDTGLGRPD